MYDKHFGLNEIPYSISPDPRFFYLSQQHKEALAKATYAINQKLGLTVVYGDIGTGKTTVARRLYQQFLDSDSHNVAMLVHSNYPTPNQLLRAIVQEFKIGKTARDKLSLLNLFENFLFAQAAEKGITQVLLIDEAQSLRGPMLELLRELLNYETNNEKLLQILLFGQDNLGYKLDYKPDLKSRVALYGSLNPLSPEDSKELLQFRYTIAGGKEIPFTEEAVDSIFRYSKGVPREICKIANNALLIAVATDKHTVDKKMVEEASKELRLGEEFEVKPRKKARSARSPKKKTRKVKK